MKTLWYYIEGIFMFIGVIAISVGIYYVLKQADMISPRAKEGFAIVTLQDGSVFHNSVQRYGRYIVICTWVTRKAEPVLTHCTTEREFFNGY